ncbi:MAG TPA: restriction endonuclease [Acidimicrobiales bacterium]|nr:restriction endonuclease [Acidimicrobiales bacterium]
MARDLLVRLRWRDVRIVADGQVDIEATPPIGVPVLIACKLGMVGRVAVQEMADVAEARGPGAAIVTAQRCTTEGRQLAAELGVHVIELDL